MAEITRPAALPVAGYICGDATGVANGRHPENVQGSLLLRVLGVRALGALSFEPGVLLLKCVGDVLEENKAEETCLYSAASTLFLSLSAASQGFASKPKVASFPLPFPWVFFPARAM
jgi:hypothetical protein